MNRRSFFARLAGSYVAAIALTLSAPKPRVVEYAMNTTPVVGGITPATYAYWRNQRTVDPATAQWDSPAMQQAMRDLFNACHRS